ncbi:MAG: hypothetical protein ABJ327_13030, partial [Litoreibacter sp.]
VTSYTCQERLMFRVRSFGQTRIQRPHAFDVWQMLKPRSLQRLTSVARFLNVKHNVIIRFVIGSLLFIFTLVCTQDVILAREVFRRAFQRDEFKTAFRRASYYARRSWLNLNVSQDLVFVFCNEMDMSELTALTKFLERRRGSMASGLYASDLSYISALRVIQTVNTSRYETELSTYSARVNEVLHAIEGAPFEGTAPMEEKPKDTFDLKNAELAIKDFATLMARNQYQWFILSGTLLGAVREGGFLKHDYDIDVGVFADACSITQMMAKLTQSDNFSCGTLDNQTIFNKGGDGKISVSKVPVFLKVVHTGGIHIDIFVHHTEGPITWHASSLFRWENSNFELSDYDLAGLTLKGPKDYDRYLTENYGNWRVPKTEFQSSVDTTNQRVVANPLSIAIFLRRIWLSKRHNPLGATALERALVDANFLMPGPDDALVFNETALL